jgi:hypothetical protein
VDGARAGVVLPVGEAAVVRAVAAAAGRTVLIGRPAAADGPRSASGRCATPLAGGVRRVAVPLREVQPCEAPPREEQRPEEQRRVARRVEGYLGAGACCRAVRSVSRVPPCRRLARGLRGWSWSR